MPRYLRWCFSFLMVALLVGAPLGYALRAQKQFRNFRVVREDVLYRSGQLTLAGLKQVIHDHGIKTVVTLRDRTGDGEGSPDIAEEEYCKAQEINYIRIPPSRWESDDGGPPPVDKGVKQFRAVMAGPANYPVLVHCFAGIHRTGAYCAIYRMEHEHWTNAQAIAEMKACGYTNLDEELDILGYLEQYRPTWKEADPNEPPADKARPASAEKRRPSRPRRS